MPKKRKTKSSADQHIWKEILIQPELFAPTIEIPEATENEIAVVREAKTLVQQLLFDRMIEIALSKFSPHQLIVLALISYPDRTYNEVAEILGINYTGVSHAIKGIKSNKHGKFHGGYEKKLRKYCMNDDECQEYLGYVKELRENNVHYALDLLIKLDDDYESWEKLKDDPKLWEDPNFWNPSPDTPPTEESE